MSIAEKVQAQLEEKAAIEVGAPVVHVGAVNRIGTLGYLARSVAMDIAGELLLGERLAALGPPRDEIRRDNGQSTKLPSAFVLVVTAVRIHVFDVRFGPGARVKFKGELGCFERATLQLDVQEDKVLTQYLMYSPQQGQDMGFEMMGGSTAGGEYTRKLTAVIRGR